MSRMQIDCNQSSPRRNRKRKLNMMDQDDDYNMNFPQGQQTNYSISRPIFKRPRYDDITLKITIKMGNISKEIYLEKVSQDCTMRQLSAIICNHENLDATTTIVIFPFNVKSEQDLNLLTLRYLSIKPGHSLEVSLKFKNESDLLNYASSIKGSMVIFVKTLKGKFIWLSVNNTDTLNDIKQYIKDCEGIPVQQQRFIFRNKPMDDSKTLKDHGIYHLGSINLVLRLRGGGCAFKFGARHNNNMTYDDIRNDKYCEELLIRNKINELRIDNKFVGDNSYEFWRVCPGLNYCGKCINKDCKAYKEPIIKNRGFGDKIEPFMEYETMQILCPGCSMRFEFDGFTLYQCDAKLKYKIVGEGDGEIKEIMFKPRRNEYIDFNERGVYEMFEFSVSFIGKLS